MNTGAIFVRSTFVVLVALWCAAVSFLHGTDVLYAAETIPSFDARITVHENATIDVAERILYDFGENERHGIFRTIPYSYQAGTETYTADISSVIVTNDAGDPLPFTESRDQGALTVQIGDPEKTVTGLQSYVVSYVVEGPFLYFDDKDELYWNVTGVWPKGIERASVLIDMPYGASVLDAACYQGKSDAVTACTKDERLVSSSRAGYNAVAEDLAAGEGFTVAVAFPKGVIAEIEQPWVGRLDSSPLRFAPYAVVPVVCIGMWYLWYTRGRDPKGSGVIVAEFVPPEGLSPGVAGVLMNGNIEPREIMAEILRLAVGGFVRLRYIARNGGAAGSSGHDLLIERVPSKEPEDAVGTALLAYLFQPALVTEVETGGEKYEGVYLSLLGTPGQTNRPLSPDLAGEVKQVARNVGEYYRLFKQYTDTLYEEVVARGYYRVRPDRAIRMYAAWGVALALLGLFSLGPIMTVYETPILLHSMLSVILSGFMIAGVGAFMAVRTELGARVREQLMGFKLYLSVAEKDRLAFHNAPELTPETFDANLPYAVAFGVEEAWARLFEGVKMSAPPWYIGSEGQAFTAGALVADIGTMTSHVSAAMAPSSSGSSGGGRVGGGFGGGRGGSW